MEWQKAETAFNVGIAQRIVGVILADVGAVVKFHKKR